MGPVFRRILLNFDPSWFTISMGTGVIGSIIASVQHGFPTRSSSRRCFTCSTAFCLCYSSLSCCSDLPYTHPHLSMNTTAIRAAFRWSNTYESRHDREQYGAYCRAAIRTMGNHARMGPLVDWNLASDSIGDRCNGHHLWNSQPCTRADGIGNAAASCARNRCSCIGWTSRIGCQLWAVVDCNYRILGLSRLRHTTSTDDHGHVSAPNPWHWTLSDAGVFAISTIECRRPGIIRRDADCIFSAKNLWTSVLHRSPAQPQGTSFTPHRWPLRSSSGAWVSGGSLYAPLPLYTTRKKAMFGSRSHFGARFSRLALLSKRQCY